MSQDPNIIEDSANPSKTTKTSSRRSTSGTSQKKAENPKDNGTNIVNEEGQTVIAATEESKSSGSPKSNVHSKDESGVIGSHSADRALKSEKKEPAQTDHPVETKKAKPKKAAAPKVEKDKAAVWALKHMRWSGVGELHKGYNIVSKEAAEKWLGRNGVREATPEEVAAHYGK